MKANTETRPPASFEKPSTRDAIRGLGTVYGGPIALEAWWLGSLMAALARRGKGREAWAA